MKKFFAKQLKSSTGVTKDQLDSLTSKKSYFSDIEIDDTVLYFLAYPTKNRLKLYRIVERDLEKLNDEFYYDSLKQLSDDTFPILSRK